MGVYVATEEQRAQASGLFGEIDAEIEEWVGQGAGAGEGEVAEECKGALTRLLATQLDLSDSTCQSLVVQHACSALVRSPLPLPLLSAIFTSFTEHNESVFLQEALMDVIEVEEEADADAKDEVTRLAMSKKEGLGEEEVKQLDEELAAFISGVQERSERRLGLTRSLLESGFLTLDLAAHLLDTQQIFNLGVLIHTKFTGNERRRRTTQFFKQKKYTLLRECSEGWTRLLVLLGDESLLGSGGDGEDASDRARRARTLWKRTLAIIGLFDLSPPRVLDIILDAFCYKLSTHWRFFVDLLDASPWGKRNRGNAVGGKGKQRADVDAMDLSDDGTSGAEMTEFIKAVSEEVGNATLAQVLGFKFVEYQIIEGDLKSLHREVDATPRELLLMTAILMREGLVRTLDILPHLSPDDKGMNSLALRYAKKVKEQIQNLGGNALMNSGPLSDESGPTIVESTAPPGVKAGEAAVQTIKKDLVEQRSLLCEALLAIGHLSPAFYLLSRWPIMAQAHPVISDHILRIIHYRIVPAYTHVTSNKPAQAAQTLYRSHFAFSEPKEIITTLLPVPPETEKRRYKFFFTEWDANLPTCGTIEEVADAIWPLVRFVGAMGARDVGVLVKLCRIGVQHMRSQCSEDVKGSWLNIIRTCLLPAMPLLTASLSYNNEVWPLLKPFKYTFRYALYGEWHLAMTDSFEKRTYNPTMALAAARTMNDAKQVLKRMTSDLERAHARVIGKASYSAPTAMWSVILPQISSYQNMIPTVVESARYLSEFGWDVTIYMLLDALSDTTKDRVKDDGLSASTWLQGVSSFIGTLARKFPAMDLEPFLQHIANQLKARSVADLITLRELIIKMADIHPLQDVSEDQVACFTGGNLLQQEGIKTTGSEIEKPPTTDVEKATWAKSNKKPAKRAQHEKSIKRLVNTLKSTGLALPILVGIAQARQISAYVAKARLGHTKQMSLAFDQCQGIFLQYLRLFVAGLGQEQYAQWIPPLRQLQRDYNLDAAVCYEILRPKLAWQINNREEYLRIRLRKYRKELPDNERELAEWDDSHWQAPLWTVMVDSAVASSGRFASLRLQPFFASFWQLSLPELSVPEEAYRKTVQRLEGVARDLNVHRSIAHDQLWADSYKSNRHEILARIQAMEDERLLQRKAVEVSLARLRSESSHWFSEFSTGTDRQTRRKTLVRLHAVLHQQCFYPRSIFSMADATFVAAFGKLLHRLNTDNFSLFVFYGKFFDDALGACLFACSETEAGNLARCLLLLLRDMEGWRASEALFKAEGTGEQPDGTFKFQGLRVNNNQWLTWDQYRTLCRQWHRKICKAIKGCLASTDYLHVKNGIILGNSLVPLFPKITSTQQELSRACRSFLEAEAARLDARDDVVILVKTYEDTLNVAERNPGISKLRLVPDEQFSPPPVIKAAPVKENLSLEKSASPAKPQPPISRATSATSNSPVKEPGEAGSQPPVKPEGLAPSTRSVDLQSGAQSERGNPATSIPSGQSLPNPEANADLSSLRERLMLNRTSTKAPRTPPQDRTPPQEVVAAEAGSQVEFANMKSMSGVAASASVATGPPIGPRAEQERSTVIKGNATSQAPQLSASDARNPIPTEPRVREPPREPRSRQSSRAGEGQTPTGPAADMVNIPKGPRSTGEARTPERRSLIHSRQPSPGDPRFKRRDMTIQAGPSEPSMQPPASRAIAPVLSSSDGTRSRRTSPDRGKGRRDTSVESKHSRASERLKSTREAAGAHDGHKDARRDRETRQREREAEARTRDRDAERVNHNGRAEEKVRDRTADREGSTKPSVDGTMMLEKSGRDSEKRDRNDRPKMDRERDSRPDDRKDRERRAREDRSDRHRFEHEDKAIALPDRDERKRTDRDRDREKEREREREKEKERDRQKQRDRERERNDERERDTRVRDRGGKDDRSRVTDRERDRHSRDKDSREDRDKTPREQRSREKLSDRDDRGHDRSDRRDRDRRDGEAENAGKGVQDDRITQGKSGSEAPPRELPPHLAKQAERAREAASESGHLDLLSARFEDRRQNQGVAETEVAAPRPSSNQRDQQPMRRGREEDQADVPITRERSREREVATAARAPSSSSNASKLAQRISDPHGSDKTAGLAARIAAPARELLTARSDSSGPPASFGTESAPPLAGLPSAAAKLGLPTRATNGIRSPAAIEASARTLSDAPLGTRIAAPATSKLGARITPAPEAPRLAGLRVPARPASISPTLTSHGLPSRPATSSSSANASPMSSNLAAALSQASVRGGSPASNAPTATPMGRTLKRPSENPAENVGDNATTTGQKRPRIDRQGAGARERVERQPRGGPGASAFSRLSGLIKPADGTGR